MVADTDLQVWLDSRAVAAQVVMIPYVRSARDTQIIYSMNVIQNKGGNTARISQKGKVSAAAAADTALTRVALSMQKEGECRVELVVSEEGKDAATYHFDCAPQR